MMNASFRMESFTGKAVWSSVGSRVNPRGLAFEGSQVKPYGLYPVFQYAAVLVLRVGHENEDP